MKQILFTLTLAAMLLTLSACDKEHITPQGGQTEIPTTFDIVHTSWRGQYQGSVVHPQAGNLPCILTWTLDFVDDHNVSILLEMTTGGQAQQPQELTCTYTYSGLSGELVSVEDGEEQRDSFTIDPVNRTLTVNIACYTGFTQENPQLVGGPTTFHQIH